MVFGQKTTCAARDEQESRDPEQGRKRHDRHVNARSVFFLLRQWLFISIIGWINTGANLLSDSKLLASLLALVLAYAVTHGYGLGFNRRRLILPGRKLGISLELVNDLLRGLVLPKITL